MYKEGLVVRSEKVRRLGQACQLPRGAQSHLARAEYLLFDDEHGSSQSEEGQAEVVKKEKVRGKKRTSSNVPR